jgi:hypothetical protein
VVIVTESYGRIISFLDRSRYLFFQVAPQVYSRVWVDPVPDHLLLRKSGRAGESKPGPLDLQPGTLTTRPQRWSPLLLLLLLLLLLIIIIIIMSCGSWWRDRSSFLSVHITSTAVLGNEAKRQSSHLSLSHTHKVMAEQTLGIKCVGYEISSSDQGCVPLLSSTFKTIENIVEPTGKISQLLHQ